MLDDVDRSLRCLLEGAVGDDVAIAFDPPSQSWAISSGGTDGVVLDVFLYDVREEVEGRNADWEDVRDERGVVVARQPPPRRYQLSYLLSAWGADPVAEHAVLGRVLAALPPSESFDPDDLQGGLSGQHRTVLLRVGRPDAGPDVKLSDVWSALGTPPRTALEVTVVAPLVPAVTTDVAPPAERIHLDVASPNEAPPPSPPSPVPVGRIVKRWSGFQVTERASDPAP